MSLSTRHLAALTAAAEQYEAHVASGALRGEAFRAALASLGRGATGRPVTVVPAELPAVLEGLVRSQVSGDWRAVLAEVRGGKSRHPTVSRLRGIIAYVLLEHGYHPRAIGEVMGRDRSTVIQTAAKTKRLMRDDAVLRQRVARVMGGAERRAA